PRAISPCASATARSLLPLAVGPAMSATAFRSGDCPVLIARLIADPATLDTRLDAATAALEAEGLKLAGAQLADAGSERLQLRLASGEEAARRRVIDALFAPSDAIIARDVFSVPDLFVSDMDSTLIGQECTDELADFAGLKDRIAA